MKKISYVRKTKIYEKLKTALLVLLFLSGLFLGYRVFEIYMSQTASDTSNTDLAFSSFSEGVVPQTEEENLLTFQKWAEPQVLLINSTSKRVLVSDKDDLNQILGEIPPLLQNTYSLGADMISPSSEKEWQIALKNDSLYLRYPEKRFTLFETSFNGKSSSGISSAISYYKEFVVIPDSKGKITLIFRGEDGEKFVKVDTTYVSPKISSLVSEYSKNQDSSHLFFYELSSLSSFAFEEVSLIDPMLLIPKDGIYPAEISFSVPKSYKAGLHFTKVTDFTTGLIRIFGYNLNTVRQYVNSDNTLIFVGETGTLSVYPHGKIEYKSLAASEGIQLRGASQPEAYSVSLNLSEILKNVLTLSGVDLENIDFEIKLTKTPSAFKPGERAEFCFDYFVDGIKIDFGKESAISAWVEGGKLTELKMHIKDIEKLNPAEVPLDFLSAISSVGEDSTFSKKALTGDILYKYSSEKETTSAIWQFWGE